MVEEIGQFLMPSQRMDVRAVALAQVCDWLVTVTWVDNLSLSFLTFPF